MFDGALRAIAVVASATIALSFVLFAAEEVSDASKKQQTAVVDPGPQAEQARAERHTQVREAIEDANDVLLSPFAALVEGSGSAWVQRGVPALIGLLLYGMGLAYLAQQGQPGASWDSVSWDSVSWDSVSWDSVSWDSVSWDSVSWDSVSWDSVGGGAVSWDSVLGDD